MYDYEDIRDVGNWSVVHCCKAPYHKELVGYTNKLHPNHPNYSYAIVGNRMALNLVDMDRFDKRYLPFNEKMFLAAFDFITEEMKSGQRILIHCNEGVSRSPMVLMLYLCFTGYKKINALDFETAVRKITYENDLYISPRTGIYETARNLWNDIGRLGEKTRKNG